MIQIQYEWSRQKFPKGISQRQLARGGGGGGKTRVCEACMLGGSGGMPS